MADDLQIQVDPTPNPNSIKVTLNRSVVESGSKSFSNAEDAQDSPVAQALFSIEGVKSVFMLNNFITVTQAGGHDWNELVGEITEAINDSLG